MARAITAPIIGRIIARLAGDRIPVLRFGLRIDTSNPHLSPRTKAELFFGIFESAELRLVQSLLSGERPVVELGAGIGVVTMAIARKLSGYSPIIAVEANAWLLDSLKKNTESGGDVHVVHGAIDYSNASEIQLALGATHIGSSVTRPRTHGATTVPALKLRTVVRDASLRDYALVCDIEGAEVPMILHDAEALRACQELVIELHHTMFAGRAYSPDDVLRLLSERGLERIASIGDVHYLRRRRAD